MHAQAGVRLWAGSNCPGNEYRGIAGSSACLPHLRWETLHLKVNEFASGLSAVIAQLVFKGRALLPSNLNAFNSRCFCSFFFL